MKKYSIICVLLLISTFCSATNIEIPFQYVNGLLIINASIDSKEGAFVFDSGSSDLLLDKSDMYGNETVQFSTLSGVIESGIVEIQEVRVGASLLKYNTEAYIMDLSDLREFTSIDLDGIIGTKGLGIQLVSIDFHEQVIELQSTPSALKDYKDYKTLVFKSIDEFVLIKCTVQDITGWFLFDSGATCHFIDKDLFNNNPNNTSELITAAGKTDILQKSSLNLTIGDIPYQSQKFLHADLTHINQELDQSIIGIISLSAIAVDEIVINWATSRILLK